MSENEKETGSEDSEPKYIPGMWTGEDLDAILKDTEGSGFEWRGWDASSDADKDGNKFPTRVVLRKDVQALPWVTDVDAFRTAFGPTIVSKGLNGTSIRVAGQQVVRSHLLQHWAEQRAKNVTVDDLRREVIKRVLLNIRAPGGGGTRKVYVGAEGKEYKTLEEAQASIIAATPKVWKGLDGKEYPTLLEAKQASVGHLVDQGFPVDLAQKAVAGMTE